MDAIGVFFRTTDKRGVDDVSNVHKRTAWSFGNTSSQATQQNTRQQSNNNNNNNSSKNDAEH